MTDTAEHLEELVQRYAGEAKEQAASDVQLLDDALEAVKGDLGIGSDPGLLGVAWIPSVRLDEVDPPWGAHQRGSDLNTWGGIVYLRGQRTLVLEVDPSYFDQLPYSVAEAIQDVVIEEVGEARPSCPLHGHPLKPVATTSGSFWECPDGKDLWSCPMGAYREHLGKGPGW